MQIFCEFLQIIAIYTQAVFVFFLCIITELIFIWKCCSLISSRAWVIQGGKVISSWNYSIRQYVVHNLNPLWKGSYRYRRYKSVSYENSKYIVMKSYDSAVLMRSKSDMSRVIIMLSIQNSVTRHTLLMPYKQRSFSVPPI